MWQSTHLRSVRRRAFSEWCCFLHLNRVDAARRRAAFVEVKAATHCGVRDARRLRLACRCWMLAAKADRHDRRRLGRRSLAGWREIWRLLAQFDDRATPTGICLTALFAPKR